MKSLIKVEKTINLELDEKEALWLKGLVQNPICCEQEEECEEDRVIRKIFWDALIDVKF